MKHYLVLFITIIGISFYLIDNYNSKSNFNDMYISTKQELLTQEITEYIPLQIVNIKDPSHNGLLNDIGIKESIELEVDFYTQSPFGKWGPIFEDTCEEASVLIAINYIRGTSMTKIQFRDELLKIVNWEKKTFGYYKDTGVEDTGKILKNYFNFSNFIILDNPSIEDIKKELSQENLIISPFYASGLNPNYTGDGPDYHFMVITGYTKDTFITHDVGTNQGENYHYSQKILYNRIHDFDPVNIQNGKKRLIVLKK